MNPDFPRQMAEHLGKIDAALERVSTEYSGHPIDEVRVALAGAWNGVGNGATISEPGLTDVAVRISQGKRVWIENGHVMSED